MSNNPEQYLEDSDEGEEETNLKFVPFQIDKKLLKQVVEETERNLDGDLADVQTSLELFLNSRVTEAENLMNRNYGKRLYHSYATALLSMLKSIMTVDRYDIQSALDAFRVTTELSLAFRKQTSLVNSFAGFVFGNAKAHKINVLKQMTRVQKHAELIYSECTLMKAMLYILTDPNLVGFVREGMAIRSAYQSFKVLYKYVVQVYQEHGEQGLIDQEIDSHFISGVYLGIGGFNLCFSLLPKKLLRIFELIGFAGHRGFGMKCLEIGAGWPEREMLLSIGKKKSSKYSSVENYLHSKEKNTLATGNRKYSCDLILNLYHVAFAATIPLPGSDVKFSSQILDKNMEKFPDSFVYLILKGRAAQAEAKPLLCIELLERVVELQKNWKQLVHVCYWDIGICWAVLGDWEKAAQFYDILVKENKWSEATCTYFRAAFLYEADRDKYSSEITEMMKKKFVSRKSRKYLEQNNSLLLPGYEILYMWAGFDSIPSDKLKDYCKVFDHTLSMLDTKQKETNSDDPPYKNYYDDLCLVRFLKGVASRELIIPNHQFLTSESELVKRVVSKEDRDALQFAARQLEFIALQADQIVLDHWILLFSRYELGQLYMRLGNYEKAREEYEAASKGGYTENEVGTQKKKTSMEQSIYLKVHNALVKLDLLEIYAGQKKTTAEEEEESDED